MEKTVPQIPVVVHDAEAPYLEIHAGPMVGVPRIGEQFTPDGVKVYDVVRVIRMISGATICVKEHHYEEELIQALEMLMGVGAAPTKEESV